MNKKIKTLFSYFMIIIGALLFVCVLLVFIPFLIAGIFLIGRYFFAKTFIGFATYTFGLIYSRIFPSS